MATGNLAFVGKYYIEFRSLSPSTEEGTLFRVTSTSDGRKLLLELIFCLKD